MQKKTKILSITALIAAGALLSPGIRAEISGIVASFKVLYMGDSIVAREDLNGYGSIGCKILKKAGINCAIERSSEFRGGNHCTIMEKNTADLPKYVGKHTPVIFGFNPGIDQVTDLCKKDYEHHFSKFKEDLKVYIKTFKEKYPTSIFVYNLNTRVDEWVSKWGTLSNRLDVWARELNNAAMEVAREMQVPSLDLHSPCIINDYKTTDGRHLDLDGGVGIGKISSEYLGKYKKYVGTGKAPWIYITSPAYSVYPIRGISVHQAQSISIKADAGGAQISRVEFFNGDNKIGQDNSAPYELNTSLAQGQHHLTAVLIDKDGVAFPSPQVRVWAKGSKKAATLPLKVNVGGPTEGAFLADQEWAEDLPFGHQAKFSASVAVSGPSEALHKKARWFRGDTAHYQIRVPNPGTYYVGLTVGSRYAEVGKIGKYEKAKLFFNRKLLKLAGSSTDEFVSNFDLLKSEVPKKEVATITFIAETDTDLITISHISPFHKGIDKRGIKTHALPFLAIQVDTKPIAHGAMTGTLYALSVDGSNQLPPIPSTSIQKSPKKIRGIEFLKNSQWNVMGRKISLSN